MPQDPGSNQPNHEQDVTKRSLSGHRFMKLGFQVCTMLMLLSAITLAIDSYRLTSRDNHTLTPAIMQHIKQQLSSADQLALAAGKPVLVYVWATWCGVCKLTSKAVSNLTSDYPVVSIALKSGTPASVAAYQAQHDIAFPVINDANGAVAQQLEIKGTPSFLILDSHGKIHYYSVGVNTEIGLRAKLAVFDQT
ncbi:MAG: protein disulfide oxidoreductase [Pseudomonadales bacterium]|nr:protein disulfide oxidoreductase [Pseudomonadales bacterium]